MEFTKMRPDGASVATQLGELTLHRARSRTYTDTTESWRVELDGRPLAELPRFGQPGFHAAKLARRGVTGTFDGAELHIRARGRHLLRSGRFVEFRAGDRTLRFVRRGLLRAELLEDGRTSARSDGRVSAEPDPLLVCAVALYTWAELDYVNANPVLCNVISSAVVSLLF
ncbi:hypothetical protein TR51_14270 [Kitasatospora griseola]|uniref:Uncharacterized protein n=1 Tax=Kitasatospora griseola TaxID=2064 RepID=A0A0D0P0W3_KITGR|nr:hypothetical protein [Kitasatospora griseola]KIQ65161.1 hypothetical protein TR51_14270 [Kitasatospora griseola]